jgi:hypothetical protein
MYREQIKISEVLAECAKSGQLVILIVREQLEGFPPFNVLNALKELYWYQFKFFSFIFIKKKKKTN